MEQTNIKQKENMLPDFIKTYIYFGFNQRCHQQLGLHKK